MFEQFRRVANIYFLIISALQVGTTLSPTNKYATALPLLGVLLVTMIKELYEDYLRHRADDAVNASRVLVLRDTAFVATQWSNLTVGDVVRLENHEFVPADIVVLSSSDALGLCYVETSGLDGCVQQR